jgi:RNA polymerase sigma-70 factor (ECF subfamily)
VEVTLHGKGRTGESQHAGPELTDEQLLERVQRGSERHFNQFYDRYFSKLYGFHYQRVGGHGEAEELTQETFLRIFRAAGSYRGRGSARAWAFGVARRILQEHRRRQARRRATLDRAGALLLCTDSVYWSSTPEDLLCLDRYAMALEGRLARLQTWSAAAFWMRHADDLPIREISRRMGRSEDAIRAGLCRTKRSLVSAGPRG